MAADESQGLAAWHSVVRLPEFPVEAREHRARRHRPDLPASVARARHLPAHRDDGFGDDLDYYLTRMEQTRRAERRAARRRPSALPARR